MGDNKIWNNKPKLDENAWEIKMRYERKRMKEKKK